MASATLNIVDNETPNAIKAWVMEKPGEPADLALKFVEKPEPADREVRVRVVAVAANPCDWRRCDGKKFPGAPYPVVIGSDVAGIVDVVGKDVNRFKVGDRVHFYANPFPQWCGFAEYVVQHELRVAKIPDEMDFGTAAAIPCAAWTAYEALFHRFKIEPGKTIYVAAGAGGVGGFAIQLAKNAGLKVVTTASGDNVERLRSEGYTVIDYKKEDFREAAKKATTATASITLDSFGDKEAVDVFASMKPFGQYVQLVELVAMTMDVFFRSLVSYVPRYRLVHVHRGGHCRLRNHGELDQSGRTFRPSEGSYHPRHLRRCARLTCVPAKRARSRQAGAVAH
jgi:NADPH2:quinone reductase